MFLPAPVCPVYQLWQTLSRCRDTARAVLEGQQQLAGDGGAGAHTRIVLLPHLTIVGTLLVLQIGCMRDGRR